MTEWNARKIFSHEYFVGGKANYEGYLRDHRFPKVAKFLVETFDLRGKAVLDCGCAIPYLVDELRKLGVDAVGFDISDYAVEGAIREKITWFVQADALHIPFRSRAFYLVIASELVEHIPHKFEDVLLQELARVTDRFLLIRTPFWKPPWDRDETHINVRPHTYWIYRLEDMGFIFRHDLFEEYARKAKPEIAPFFDEFLVFERIDHTWRWLEWESRRRGLL